MKTLIVLGLIAFFISNSTHANDFTPLPEVSFNTDVQFENFDSEGQSKVQKALEAIKVVVESQEFKDTVLNFKDNKGRTQFVDNNGLTNAQIYEVILKGSENFRQIDDNTMNLKLSLYYSRRNTVGYTYPDSDTIWMNNKFFASYEVQEVSDNLFHEWMHKLGFDHNNKATWNYSVPYGLGYKMEELVGRYLKGESL